MKRLKFRYEKANGDQNEYNLLVVNSTPDRFYGIDLNKLNEKEQEEVKRI